MKYLPIMSELFSSDSSIFLLIGLAAAIIISLILKILKSDKKIKICMIISGIAYVLGEIISNIPTSFLIQMITLFIGTIALGCFLGFSVAFLIYKRR